MAPLTSADNPHGTDASPAPEPTQERAAELVASVPKRFEQAFWEHRGLLSDKWLQYLPVYQAAVDRVIANGGPMRLLEIGVQNGGSLQIWAKVLPAGSQVVGIDVDPRCTVLPVGEGIRIVLGDATDRETVERQFEGEFFDIIVDDGSHVSSDVIAAFFACFPHLAPGGTYLVEDLHASYWATHGGGLRRPGSAMEFMKSLADALHADHFELGSVAIDSETTELIGLGAWIERVSFHDSIVSVHKRVASKRRPHGRAVTGLRADVAPALDVLLAVPAARLYSVAASEATAHVLDMQMLEQVRRRRMETADLHDRLRELEIEVQAANQDIETVSAALKAARTETEVARQEARIDAETVRQEARTEVEMVRHEAERRVSRARVQRDNARLEMSREIARANSYYRAACDAAVARATALENSPFWRLTGPIRRMLRFMPWLHRFSQGAIQLTHRIPVIISRQRAEERTDGAVPDAASPVATKVDPVAIAAPEQPLLFDEIHALQTVQLPADARHCLIVPFETSPPTAPVPRIAVMIHAFYPERLPLILERVSEIPGSPDLFVTTDTEDKRAKIEGELSEWRTGRTSVRILTNRGRDIAPKLFGLADVYANYDLVLHLHTKRSPHAVGGNGNDWFNHLLQTLVGSERVVRSVLAAFAVQPKLGLLFADHWHPVRGFLNWGDNYPIARNLAAQMGFCLFRDEPLEFASGSMFWARPAALAPLLALQLSPEDFPEETGQLDGTTAHAIERLFLRVCEYAGYSWARIAHTELFSDDESRAVRVKSEETLVRALRRHPALLADPALRSSVRVIAGKPETWPIRIAPEFDERPRVNLIIPTFRASSVFGGIATAHALFERVADALGPDVERRMIITTEDQPIAPQDLPEGWSFARSICAGGDRSVVFLARGVRFEHGLPVRPHDVFFASAWWDAAACYGLMDLQRGFFGCTARLRYFIQDYEPNFSPWSASWALAEQTYHRPDDTVAMVNSHFLADYMDQLGLRFRARHVFQPLWNKGLGSADSNSAGRENLLLVYWRPYVERNLCPIIEAALAQWLEENPYSAQHWSIVGIGQDGDDVRLTDWRSMTTIGKLTLMNYKALLRRAKVGLALMLSPYPSYPPLEMAAFGMRVVTNGFGPKDLSRFGDRIESLPHPRPEAVAAALRRATEFWTAGSPGAASFDTGSAFATEAELEALVADLATDIRSELGMPHSTT